MKVLRNSCIAALLFALLPSHSFSSATSHVALNWPAVDQFTFRGDGSAITISVRLGNLIDKKGRFKDFAGEAVAENEGNTYKLRSVKISIRAYSIDTGDQIADWRRYRGSEWLDVATYPSITFESHSVEQAGTDIAVTGVLTLHGVSKRVVIPFVIGTDINITRDIIGLRGTLNLSRNEFGLKTPSDLSDEVRVDINLLMRGPQKPPKR